MYVKEYFENIHCYKDLEMFLSHIQQQYELHLVLGYRCTKLNDLNLNRITVEFNGEEEIPEMEVEGEVK